MQIKKEKVRARIMKNAKKEFLEHGYENVSIRTIAKKSGITSGTIYTYFKDKNAVFEAIVKPTAQRCFKQMQNTMRGFHSQLDDIPTAFSPMIGKTVIIRLFDMIYSDLDNFKLLLCRSKGSSMENFLDNVVLNYSDLCLSLLNAISDCSNHKKNFSPISVHVILGLFIQIVEEIISEDIPRKEADKYVDELSGIIYGAWNGLINY